jgi:hypothetical protein
MSVHVYARQVGFQMIGLIEGSPLQVLFIKTNNKNKSLNLHKLVMHTSTLKLVAVTTITESDLNNLV